MIMAATAVSESLGSIIGPENVITDTEWLRAYRLRTRTPKLVLRPGSEREIVEIVRFAAAEKLSLVPAGARSKLAMNIPVHAHDIALDMTRLDRVVAYDADDLTLSVQPGLPLSRLAGILGERGQFLPLAVAFENRASVGGTIASGMDSPLRQLYGTARDYVLGMEFVTGDGQLVKSGGRVVKNVSGYDLHKLMIGSFGSLGVITRINFRTFPATGSMRGFVSSAHSALEVAGMRQRIAQSPLRPLTIEMADPTAVELLWGNTIRSAANGNWALLVTFAGSEKVLGRYEREVRHLAGSHEIELLDEKKAAAALSRVREFAPLALESSAQTVIVKMSVLPSRLAPQLDEAARVCQGYELRWAALARGIGVIYFALLPSAQDEETRDRVNRALCELFEATEGRGGNFTVPWCPEEWNADVFRRKTTRNDLEQMRKIKRVFDPNGVFACGVDIP